MDPFFSMEQHKNLFTQNDLIIYNAILKNPEQIVYQSTSKLAKSLGISQPALSRFIKTIGYKRYQDFRSDLTGWLAKQKKMEETGHLTYFDRLYTLLDEAEHILTDDFMTDLASYVQGFSRLFASGIGKSLHPALLLQTLARKDFFYVTVCCMDTLNEYADHLTESDLMIVFSVSAQSDILDRLKNTRGKILLVTTNSFHGYEEVVDRTVVLPYLPPEPESCSVSPVLFDIFVELLEQYISFHHDSL